MNVTDNNSGPVPRGDKPVSADSIYRFGAFELDLNRYELRRSGRRLHLRRSPMDLLALLVERRGGLVSREEIAARLWSQPGLVDVDQGINSAVRRIREVLVDEPTKPKYIETVVGKGYRFVAHVEMLVVDPVSDIPTPRRSSPQEFKILTPAPSQQAAEWPADGARAAGSSLSSSRKVGFSLIVILAAFAVLGGFFLRHKRSAAISLNDSVIQVTTNDSELRVTAASISPDGSWIAYADMSGLTLRSLQTGETTDLKAPSDFRPDRIAWFPDQLKLLASGMRGTEPEIWTIFITGQNPQIFRKSARNGVPSPQGDRIAFTADHDASIWTAGAEGENARAFIADASGNTFRFVFWSSDGKRLSYFRSGNSLGVGDYESVNSTSGEVLASEKSLRLDSAYTLQNGNMFFLRDSDRNGGRYSLWEVDTRGDTGAFISAPRLVRSFEGTASSITSSADGSRVSWILTREPRPQVYVGSLHAPGPQLSGQQRLTFDTRTDFPHSWLYDNETVVFESNRTGEYRIYTQRLTDRHAQEISPGGEQAVLPQVSPDGKWILYAVKPDLAPSLKDALFRIPVNGGTPIQVPIGGPLDEFACPLMGKSGCVLRESEGHAAFVYYRLDPISGKGREIGRTSWLPHVVQDWCVSPDGNAVALTSHEFFHSKIRIVSLATPHVPDREVEVKGIENLSGISWSADGQGWYVAAGTKTGVSLLFVDLQGNSHILQNTARSTWGIPSPDGHKLAYVDQKVDSNVWLWKTTPQR